MIYRFVFVCLFVFSSQFVSGQDFATPQDSDFPDIVKTGKTANDFVPQGWKITGEAKGDLNTDNISDTALVVKGTNPKFIYKNSGLGTPEFDVNPRILIILFGTKEGFRLAQKSNSIIATAYSPTMEEPFDSIKIKDRILQIEQHVFMSAGGWGTSRYIYKFRFQSGDFRLIGADKFSVQRNTGETESRSYNFLTRKVKIETGNIEDDKGKTITRNFVIRRIHTLKTFKTPIRMGDRNRLLHLVLIFDFWLLIFDWNFY